jgi:hypothetical protein
MTDDKWQMTDPGALEGSQTSPRRLKLREATSGKLLRRALGKSEVCPT